MMKKKFLIRMISSKYYYAANFDYVVQVLVAIY